MSPEFFLRTKNQNAPKKKKIKMYRKNTVNVFNLQIKNEQTTLFIKNRTKLF